MPVAIKSSRFFLCTSLYTAKKSYFALSSLSEFLRVSAGCSNKQPVFLYAKIFSLLVLTLSTLLSEPLWRGSRRRRDFLPFTRCGKQALVTRANSAAIIKTIPAMSALNTSSDFEAKNYVLMLRFICRSINFKIRAEIIKGG